MLFLLFCIHTMQAQFENEDYGSENVFSQSEQSGKIRAEQEERLQETNPGGPGDPKLPINGVIPFLIITALGLAGYFRFAKTKSSE